MAINITHIGNISCEADFNEYACQGNRKPTTNFNGTVLFNGQNYTIGNYTALVYNSPVKTVIKVQFSGGAFGSYYKFSGKEYVDATDAGLHIIKITGASHTNEECSISGAVCELDLSYEINKQKLEASYFPLNVTHFHPDVSRSINIPFSHYIFGAIKGGHTLKVQLESLPKKGSIKYNSNITALPSKKYAIDSLSYLPECESYYDDFTYRIFSETDGSSTQLAQVILYKNDDCTNNASMLDLSFSYLTTYIFAAYFFFVE